MSRSRLVLLILILIVGSLIWWFQTASREGITAGSAPEGESNPELTHRQTLQRAKFLATTAPQEARSLLESIPANSAHFGEAQRFLAGLAMIMKDWHTSLEILKKLRAQAPNDPALLLAYSQTCFQTENFMQSLHVASKLVDVQPDSVEGWLLIADSLDRLGRRSESLRPLRQAVRLEPGSHQIRLSLTTTLFALGQLETALSEVQNCDQSDVDVMLLQAQIQQELGRSEGALESVERLLRKSPDHLAAQKLLAELLVYQQDYDRALAVLESLVRPKEQDRHLLQQLIIAAQRSGDMEKAQRYHDHLRELLQKEDQ